MPVDGTWLGREHCLIVYRDNTSKSTVHYRFASAEKEYEIIKDLEAFKQLKISASSFTTDGSEDIIRAVKYAYPRTTRQRCILMKRSFCAGEGSRTHTHEALDPKSSLSTNFNTPAKAFRKVFNI